MREPTGTNIGRRALTRFNSNITFGVVAIVTIYTIVTIKRSIATGLTTICTAVPGHNRTIYPIIVILTTLGDTLDIYIYI